MLVYENDVKLSFRIYIGKVGWNYIFAYNFWIFLDFKVIVKFFFINYREYNIFSYNPSFFFSIWYVYLFINCFLDFKVIVQFFFHKL